MKRILFVDHTPFAGGAQLVLAEHIRHLDRARFQPLVACTNVVPALPELYRQAGAEVHIVALPRLRGMSIRGFPAALRSIASLRRLVRTERVDLVVSNTSRAAYLSALALLGTGVPLIWWIRDFLYGRFWFRLLRRVPARVMCVSHAIRDYYGGTGDPRFEVVFVGNSLYRDLEKVTRSDLDAERERWGLREEDLVIGFMGRLVADKGVQDLMDAVARVHESHPQVRLLVVGTGAGQEGSVEDALKQRVAAHDHSYVKLAGFQPNEALYYRMFDIFVLSSRAPEALSTSIVQAMMAGKPVVATDTGGNREIVEHGVTGLLVPPADPTSMALAISELVEDPGLAERLSRGGQQRAMRNHREENTTRDNEAVYSSVAGG